jgi:histidine triad (HIT) family protein
MNCIFCKIVDGSIPASKIFEDDHVIAFLDIKPFEKGHFLVVPKPHVSLLTELPEELLKHTISVVQKLSAHIMECLPCDGFNLVQNNGACATQTVPHVHFHIIPRFNEKPLTWISSAYESDEEMKRFQARLAVKEKRA